MTRIRHPYDFYATPPAVIQNLLCNHPMRVGHYLEPCAGDGAIVKQLRRHFGHTHFGIDAVELRADESDNLELCSDGYAIMDFRHYRPIDVKYSTIISNPPFSIAEEIIEHCFDIAEPDTEIIMLLRLGFLESKKRRSFWQRHPCQLLYALSERPSFTGEGTDKTAYGWFVWNSEKTGIYVI